VGVNELHWTCLLGLFGLSRLFGVRRLAAECPLDRYLPTGVAQSRRWGPPQGCDEKSAKYFRPGPRQNYTLRASFWLQFLHWNKSKLEITYCIKGF
jgi:hypothetical protein